jgi:hypothetical protein
VSRGGTQWRHTENIENRGAKQRRAPPIDLHSDRLEWFGAVHNHRIDQFTDHVGKLFHTLVVAHRLGQMTDVGFMVVCTENLNTGVVVMKSAQDGA